MPIYRKRMPKPNTPPTPRTKPAPKPSANTARTQKPIVKHVSQPRPRVRKRHKPVVKAQPRIRQAQVTRHRNLPTTQSTPLTQTSIRTRVNALSQPNAIQPSNHKAVATQPMPPIFRATPKSSQKQINQRPVRRQQKRPVKKGELPIIYSLVSAQNTFSEGIFRGQKVQCHYYRYLHNLKEPAVKKENGEQTWYKFGKIHRECGDGPARTTADGTKFWYKDGKMHRDNGPAIEYLNGNRFWYREGKLHRDDGPAVIDVQNNTQQFWKNGIQIQ